MIEVIDEETSLSSSFRWRRANIDSNDEDTKKKKKKREKQKQKNLSKAHWNSVHHLLVLRNGTLVTSDRGSVIEQWSLPEGTHLRSINLGSSLEDLFNIDLSHHRLRHYQQHHREDKGADKITKEASGHEENPSSSSSSSTLSSSFFVTLCWEDICIWDGDTGEKVRTILSDRRLVLLSCIAYLRQGGREEWEVLVTGDSEKTIKLWDFETGSLRSVMKGHEDAITTGSYHDSFVRNKTR